MIEINGKYNSAKIFTDVVDEKSLEQIKTLCNQEIVQCQKIRLMPDVHAGAGCTIGTTMTIGNKVVPNLVSVDIGCGMETLVIRYDSDVSKNFDLLNLIRLYERTFLVDIIFENFHIDLLKKLLLMKFVVSTTKIVQD